MDQVTSMEVAPREHTSCNIPCGTKMVFRTRGIFRFLYSTSFLSPYHLAFWKNIGFIQSFHYHLSHLLVRQHALSLSLIFYLKEQGRLSSFPLRERVVGQSIEAYTSIAMSLAS